MDSNGRHAPSIAPAHTLNDLVASAFAPVNMSCQITAPSRSFMLVNAVIFDPSGTVKIIDGLTLSSNASVDTVISKFLNSTKMY